MASITINTSAADAQRIVAAFGAYLGLKDANGAPRDATVAEFKAAVIDDIKAVVRAQEQIAAQATANPTPIGPT